MMSFSPGCYKYERVAFALSCCRTKLFEQTNVYMCLSLYPM